MWRSTGPIFLPRSCATTGVSDDLKAGFIFDMDGTLVDSFDDLTTAINVVRGEFGLSALARDFVVEHVGHGVRHMVLNTIPLIGDVTLDDLVLKFRGVYSVGCLGQTRPYAGVPEALKQLSRRFPLAVLSNKPETETRGIVEGLGLTPFFVAVYGGDSFSTRKPDPQGLLKLIDMMGIEPSHTAMVGDSDVDIATGKAAGVKTILVRTGLYRAVVLQPDLVIDDIGELSR